jgi:hypothetical protein
VPRKRLLLLPKKLRNEKLRRKLTLNVNNERPKELLLQSKPGSKPREKRKQKLVV